MQSYELRITDLSHEGRGVARHEGKAVFVAGALPGELVRAQRTARHRQYDDAQALEIIEPSPDRVVPRCPHFGVCGGCALQHLEPGAQLHAKQRTLLDNLVRIGAVEPARVLDPLRSEPWGYRRRARLSVRRVDKKDRVLVGFRETNGRYVADISTCAVLHPAVGERIAGIAAMVATLDAQRSIPQIEVAVGDSVAALVFRHLEPMGDADLGRLRDFARSTGLAVYLQPGGIDSVVALEPASPSLTFALPRFGIEIAFEPLDFIQVNADLNARMIDHALDLLQPGAEDRVLDLFCGLGNFTLPLATRAAHVVGVEGEAGLVARARANGERNGLRNIAWVASDLGVDQREAPWAREPCDLVLLDPPRAGAAAVLEYLPRKSVRRIVYVSCHPGSLARDASTLVSRHGFDLSAAGVMDMFPHTAHVESIAVFDR